MIKLIKNKVRILEALGYIVKEVELDGYNYVHERSNETNDFKFTEWIAYKPEDESSKDLKYLLTHSHENKYIHATGSKFLLDVVYRLHEDQVEDIITNFIIKKLNK